MARTKAHYDVTVLDLLNAGILKPGDGLTFEPRRGQVYSGRVEASGDLTLDGRQFDNPSQAATTLAGNSRNGWKEIKVKGRPLMEYRDQLLAATPVAQKPAVTVTPPPQGQPSQPTAVAQPPAAPSSPPTSMSLEDLITRHLNELKRALSDRIGSLSAGQFEELVAEVLRRLGYSEVRRVGGPGDRNIDVTATFEAPLVKVGVRVQVKHRRAGPNVGPTDVAAFRDRAGGVDHTLVMVTNVEFTDGARETASEPGRQLVHRIDGKELISAMVNKRIGVKEGSMRILTIDEDFWSQF